MPVKKFDISSGSKREWIDITDPSHEELDAIAEEYHINRRVVLDCLDPDHLPKHEKLRDCAFIIIRLISGNLKAHLDSVHEMTTKIAIFCNTHFLITIHRIEQPFVEDIIKEEIDREEENSTANLLTRIVAYGLRTYEQPALSLSDQVDTYESTVLLKHTKPALLQGLYYLKRKASTCKKVLLLSEDVISFLKTTDANESVVQDVRDLYTKLITLYDQVVDDVNNLLSTYLSLNAQKTNEVMKVLTVFSVFFMPLTFVVGVYGMNFEHMPELEMKYAYPVVLSVMLLISIGIFIWMKRKRWL